MAIGSVCELGTASVCWLVIIGPAASPCGAAAEFNNPTWTLYSEEPMGDREGNDVVTRSVGMELLTEVGSICLLRDCPSASSG
jgi:hypothetical protein